MAHAFAPMVLAEACVLVSGCDKRPDDRAPDSNATITVDVPKAAAGVDEGLTPMAERVAVLGFLNKRNGITRDIKLKPGQSAKWRDLIVRLRACETTAPWEEEKLTGAFIQVEMRDLKTGNKTNERWRTADTVERLETSEKDFNYSYTDGSNIVLMDQDTFEQTIIPLALLGDMAPFLQDNMVVTVDMVDGDPTGVRLPSTVILEVTEADPVVKGQTASSSYKPALLSNGVKTMVPPFVTQGDRIVVKTEDGSYVERAKG